MRYIVFGAGAVGGVVGASLYASGHDVVLIARGAHLEAITAKGLTVDSPHGSRRFEIPAVGSPHQIEWRAGDSVLLATKTPDTSAAPDALRGATDEGDIPIACLQNGVENERLAIRRFSCVYGAMVIVPAAHLEAGIVQSESAPVTGILDVGRYPSGIDAMAERLAEHLRDSGFESRADPDIMTAKYTKLLANLHNAIQAICGLDSDTKELTARAQEEALACFAAARIRVGSPAEMAARRAAAGLGPPRATSTWQSLMRRTGTTEVDFLNGEIALLGRLHGVPTPVNATLQDYVNELARARLQPGGMDAQLLLSRLNRVAQDSSSTSH